MSTHTEDLRTENRGLHERLAEEEASNNALRARLDAVEKSIRRGRIATLVLGVIASLAILLGAVVTGPAARATTEHPTPVTFAKVHGLPTTVLLRDRMPDGSLLRQRLGTTVQHPEKVCPPRGTQTRITWSYKAPGTVREVYRLKPGECTWPGPGPVFIELWKVS